MQEQIAAAAKLLTTHGGVDGGDAALADKRIDQLDVLQVVALRIQVSGDGDLEGKVVPQTGQGGKARIVVGGNSRRLRGRRLVDGKSHFAGQSQHGGIVVFDAAFGDNVREISGFRRIVC